LLKELGDLAGRRKEEVTTVIAEALKIGVDRLWEETILEQYLKSQIQREEAIKLLGMDLVRLAEKQKDAALEDVRWGLHGA